MRHCFGAEIIHRWKRIASSLRQRVFNVLWGIRLSRRRMFWLLLHTVPVWKFSIFLGLPVNRRSRFLTQEGGGAGDGVRSQIIRRRESLVLYNLLTTFCTCHPPFTDTSLPLPPPAEISKISIFFSSHSSQVPIYCQISPKYSFGGEIPLAAPTHLIYSTVGSQSIFVLYK
jgi:hypothetical protein